MGLCCIFHVDTAFPTRTLALHSVAARKSSGLKVLFESVHLAMYWQDCGKYMIINGHNLWWNLSWTSCEYGLYPISSSYHYMCLMPRLSLFTTIILLIQIFIISHQVWGHSLLTVYQHQTSLLCAPSSMPPASANQLLHVLVVMLASSSSFPSHKGWNVNSLDRLWAFSCSDPVPLSPHLEFTLQL